MMDKELIELIDREKELKMTYPTHDFIEASKFDRVLIVGDIHGCFSLFEQKLREVEFNKQKDLCILMGDIIDRGPESHRVEEFLDFRRLLGNHESAAYESIFYMGRRFHHSLGGRWLTKLKYKRGLNYVRMLSKKLHDAPYTITLRTPAGHSVGLVHADCPDDWSEFLQKKEPSDAIWGRGRFIRATKKGEDVTVRNIDHVFMGHNIVKSVTTKNNCTWIDLGAYDTGKLMILDVDQYLKGLKNV